MSTPKGTGTHFEMVQEALNGGNTERVIACGELLTIETVSDVARQIGEGLAEADTVVFEFPENVEVDITALQLFCSACLTASAMGKKFIHRGNLPRSLFILAEAAGSERKELCNNNNVSCFRKFGGMV